MDIRIRNKPNCNLGAESRHEKDDSEPHTETDRSFHVPEWSRTHGRLRYTLVDPLPWDIVHGRSGRCPQSVAYTLPNDRSGHPTFMGNSEALPDAKTWNGSRSDGRRPEPNSVPSQPFSATHKFVMEQKSRHSRILRTSMFRSGFERQILERTPVTWPAFGVCSQHSRQRSGETRG